MKLLRVMLVCAVSFALVAGTRAAEPTKDDAAKAEIRGAAVTDIAFAGELAAFGRDAKSPESLVIAGGMLVRANKTFGGKLDALGAQPTDEKGAPVKAESVKAVPLDKQAEALFDEVRAMVATDKARTASLEALIGNAKKFESGGSSETRPAVGGPKSDSRTLQPGETHTYTVTFFGGQHASVSMTSSGPARIQMDIVNVAGGSVFSTRAVHANHGWTPPRDKDGTRRFTITLRNEGKKPTNYTITTN